MRIEPLLTEIDATIEAQLRLADPAVAELAPIFVEAFRPAVRSAMIELAQQAATEVTAQLGDRRVEVRLADGDPLLAVVESGERDHDFGDADAEARITLRLPGGLKSLIEDAAGGSGDSINGWVVEALRSRARRPRPGTRVTETFEL